MAGRVFLTVGKNVENNEPVAIEADRSRVVFICGKRGSGKSYTLGVLLEELMERTDGSSLIIVADPMGIFHTMVLPNDRQISDLYSWGLNTKQYPVRLLVPQDPVKYFGHEAIIRAMEERGVTIVRLRINAGSLQPEEWCSLLDINVNDLMGIVLYRSIATLKDATPAFTLDDIEKQIIRDRKAADKTKEALQNRLLGAKKWGIFQEAGESSTLLDLFSTECINIIDMADLPPGSFSIRNLILQVIGNQLFSLRVKERRKEEFRLESRVSRVWLAIDEAHQFVPTGFSLCKPLLIRWVKEGRQPGLSLILATQQPSAVDSDLLSQCDVILSHKITTLDDINALNRLSATYMSGEMKSLVRNLSRRGEAVLVDDETEQVSHVAIRPRKSSHGGGEIAEDKIRKTLF